MSIRVITFLIIIGTLHACGAHPVHAAELQAAPCLKPIPKQPRHHSHVAAVPVQSCATPPVPMCFREPAPEPDLLPIQPPLIYYTTPPTADDDTPSAVPGPTMIGEPSLYYVGGGGFIGTYALPTQAPIIIPPEPRYPSPPRVSHAAPEIDPGSAVSAALLLAGGLVVLRGRRA